MASSNDFLQSDCTCLGFPLYYQCIVVGIGTTVWQGSVFNCPLSSDEIQLPHDQFQRNLIEYCNNGGIVGKALRTESPNKFISQLAILNVTSAMNGTTIECVHDDGYTTRVIDKAEIAITTGIIMHIYCVAKTYVIIHGS